MTTDTVVLSPEALLREGRLEEALQGLMAQVRSHPIDAPRRVFLFQLLSLLGQWDRAEAQLIVSGELSADNALMVTAYGTALRGEQERNEVMAGSRNPTMIGEPSPWQALLQQSLHLLLQGERAQAMSLRDDAFSQVEAVTGHIDGVPFHWIADADPRFGPCLEVILKNGYAWVPFSRIAKLSFDEPSDLRDKVWAPVQITWANGGEAVGFVPCRYPHSHASSQSDIVLAKRTEWDDLGDECFIGTGQRVLATDEGDFALLDIRTIEFNQA